MDDKGSVRPAIDGSDQPTHSVDYYYLEAMRYLTCKAVHHSSDESEDDDDADHECNCPRCRVQQGSGSISYSDKSVDGGDSADEPARERSWSHSMAKDRETGTVPELPVIDGKFVPGARLRNRRYSDGMILKKTIKPPVTLADGHVHWADECKKELTRFRPRKKYSRSPSVSNVPMRSILKNSSEESLVIRDSLNSNEHSDSDTDD